MQRRGSLQRAVMARLVQITLALLCFSSTRAAQADVPMCGPNAQSIAAPPIIMPQRDARLAPEKPCEKPNRTRLDTAPDPSAPERGAAPPALDRMLPVGGLVLMGPKPTRLPAAADRHATRSGIACSVYRPPRV
jgi:hypothetical protein